MIVETIQIMQPSSWPCRRSMTQMQASETSHWASSKRGKGYSRRIYLNSVQNGNESDQYDNESGQNSNENNQNGNAQKFSCPLHHIIDPLSRHHQKVLIVTFVHDSIRSILPYARLTCSQQLCFALGW